MAYDQNLADALREAKELHEAVRIQGEEIDRLCRFMTTLVEERTTNREALHDARMALNLALLADGLSGEIKNRLRTAWLKVGDALTIAPQTVSSQS